MTTPSLAAGSRATTAFVGWPLHGCTHLPQRTGNILINAEDIGEIGHLKFVEVGSGIEHDVIIYFQTDLNRDVLVVTGANLDLASFIDQLAFFADGLHQYEHMAFELVQCLDGNLQRLFDLLNKDSHFGRHAGADFYGRVDDLDKCSVLLHRGTKIRGRFRVFVDLDHFSHQRFGLERADRNGDGHALDNQGHSSLVDLRFDLHLGGVGKLDDSLSLANHRARFHDKLGATASAAIAVRVHDDAVFRCIQRAVLDLFLNFCQLQHLFGMAADLGLLACSGGLDVGFKTDQHFSLGDFFQRFQLDFPKHERVTEL